MRAASTLVALLFVFTCAGCWSDAYAPPAADEALLPFAPLAGTWRAAVAKPGERISWTEETWSVPAGNSMVGTSRTLRHGDWSGGEFEFLRIVSRPDGVFYLASPQGRMPATEFRYDDRFICGTWATMPLFSLPKKWHPRFEFVNEAHDFPQRIVYDFESDDEMDVRIWGRESVPGDGDEATVRSLSWHFERTK